MVSGKKLPIRFRKMDKNKKILDKEYFAVMMKYELRDYFNLDKPII